MRVLNISLDTTIADQTSPAAQRAREYASLVDRYDILTLGPSYAQIQLGNHSTVYVVKRGNKIITLWRLYRALRRTLVNGGYDIVTVQDVYYVGMLTLWLVHRQQRGVEVQVHGFEKYRGVRRLIARYVLRRADAVRTVSQRFARLLQNQYGIAPDRLTVVPIHVDVTHYLTHTSSPYTSGPFVFLTVGRLVPIKRIDMQLAALATLTRNLKEMECELWIVGDGPQRQWLEARAQELGLAKHVRFWGWQDDVDALYHRAHALLLTSDREGWGMTAIEAAAHGLPVIMTDVGCAGEVIVHETSGIVIPVGDIRALREAMQRVMSDQDLRTALGRGARDGVSILLTREETLQHYLASWKKAARRLQITS